MTTTVHNDSQRSDLLICLVKDIERSRRGKGNAGDQYAGVMLKDRQTASFTQQNLHDTAVAVTGDPLYHH